MIEIVWALAPIFATIALGWGLKAAGFLTTAFWPQAEKLTYYLLFPALLIANLAAARLDVLTAAPMGLALITALLFVAGVVLLVRPLIKMDGPAFTSVFQGAIRFSTYAGITAALALYGEAGLTLAAVALAAMIPTCNILSVAALSRYGGEGAAGWRNLVGSILKNPLILGCAVGIVVNATGLGLPAGVDAVFEVLGRGALGLGLLCVGAGLSLSAAKAARREIVLVSGLKLLLLPAAAAAACAAFGVSGLAARVAILFAALPVAPASYVLARQMGGDAPLMAGIVTATTVLAAFTMPAVLAILG
ncbi:MAG: AEC family transporter [Alphaproteobacteria bacterium]